MQTTRFEIRTSNSNFWKLLSVAAGTEERARELAIAHNDGEDDEGPNPPAYSVTSLTCMGAGGMTESVLLWDSEAE